MKINEERKERELECSDDAIRMHVPVLTTAHTPLVTKSFSILFYYILFCICFLFYVLLRCLYPFIPSYSLSTCLFYFSLVVLTFSLSAFSSFIILLAFVLSLSFSFLISYLSSLTSPSSIPLLFLLTSPSSLLPLLLVYRQYTTSSSTSPGFII